MIYGTYIINIPFISNYHSKLVPVLVHVTTNEIRESAGSLDASRRTLSFPSCASRFPIRSWPVRQKLEIFTLSFFFLPRFFLPTSNRFRSTRRRFEKIAFILIIYESVDNPSESNILFPFPNVIKLSKKKILQDVDELP